MILSVPGLGLCENTTEQGGLNQRDHFWQKSTSLDENSEVDFGIVILLNTVMAIELTFRPFRHFQSYLNRIEIKPRK